MHVVTDPRPAEAAPESHPFQSEHAALFACAEELRGALARAAARAAAWPDAPELGRLLTEFQRRILAHLEAEERSGVLERAAVSEPRFARRAEALRVEHEQLRARLAALVDEAPGLAASSLRGGFEGFCSMLHVHERAENELLQSVYLDDIGGRG